MAKYQCSLHSPSGYGDLSATNVREVIYAIAVMVMGKLLFGFILGSIASTLANLDTQRVLFEEKLSALKVCTYICTYMTMQTASHHLYSSSGTQ